MKLKKVIILSFILVLVIGTTGLAAQYNEAPMLKDLVDKGELEPVEERLPEEPFVVGPGVLIPEDNVNWEVGKHGGTLRVCQSNTQFNPDVFIGTNEPILMTPGITVEPVKGNIAKDFSVNEDNTVFTFTLRKGLKWSDGVPVTTEDVRFTYEDFYLNEKITSVFPEKYRDPEGKPMKIEIIDDYTFKIIFENPYGSFLTELSMKGWPGYTGLIKPIHYLKQFHINYTSLEDMKPYLEEEQLEDEWWELLDIKDITNWENTAIRAVGFPVLYPWRMVEGPAGVYVYERNPYYFKVDTAGNQLPYIDSIRSTEVSDTEMGTMKVLTGEIDYMREDTSLNKMPLYKSNESRGGFRTIPTEMHMAPIALLPNFSYEDPTWRLVTGDVRFRQAINLAMDRQEVIDSVYLGLATMPTWVPSEYNPGKAQELLDEMGMDKRDNEGYRLAPNGEEFEFFIEYQDAAPDFAPVNELIATYLRDIGIRTSIKQISGELQNQRGAANQIKATTAWVHADNWPWLWADYATAAWGGGAPLWWSWYNSGGETGEEPPQWVKELYDIKDEIDATVPGSEERLEAKDKLRNWYHENIFEVIMVENAVDPQIVNANLGNVPTKGTTIGANYSWEQFFYNE